MWLKIEVDLIQLESERGITRNRTGDYIVCNAQVEDPAVEAAVVGEAGGEAEAAAAASSDSSAQLSWSSLVKSGGGAPGKPPVAPQQGQAPPTQAR